MNVRVYVGFEEFHLYLHSDPDDISYLIYYEEFLQFFTFCTNKHFNRVKPFQ